MLHLHGGVLCIHKKEYITDIYKCITDIYTPWTNPKAIRPSERSQTQKAVSFHLLDKAKGTQISGRQGLGQGQGSTTKGQRGLPEADGTVADLHSGGGSMAEHIC